MDWSPVTRVTMTGFAGGCICLTASAVCAKESGMVRAAEVSALSERKSRRVVMQNRGQGIELRDQGSGIREAVLRARAYLPAQHRLGSGTWIGGIPHLRTPRRAI